MSIATGHYTPADNKRRITGKTTMQGMSLKELRAGLRLKTKGLAPIAKAGFHSGTQAAGLA